VAGGNTPTANPDRLFADMLSTAPSTVLQFHASDELFAFAEVYDNELSPPHQMDLTVIVKADNGSVVFRQTDTASTEDLADGHGMYRPLTRVPLDGLQPGEKIVVDGTDRLREGAKVTMAGSGGEGHEPGEPKAAAGPGSPPPVDRQGQGGGRRRTAQ
jgi:hypothetical protein